MLVSHIIEDIELALSETPVANNFQIAFAAYHEDSSGNININHVEAFLWDEDDEFFLIPGGAAKYYDLTPSTITVNEGDTVKLTINSIDVSHGFSISAFRVSERLEPNQVVNVEFVADKKGTFPFICTVFCGSGHGGSTRRRS